MENIRLVKSRDEATRFKTDRVLFTTLCLLGIKAGEYSFRRYRGEGWFAFNTELGKWLRLEEEKPAIPKADFKDVPLLPILETIMDATGPADFAFMLAEVARRKAQHEPNERDREFWLAARRTLEAAGNEIANAS